MKLRTNDSDRPARDDPQRRAYLWVTTNGEENDCSVIVNVKLSEISVSKIFGFLHFSFPILLQKFFLSGHFERMTKLQRLDCWRWYKGGLWTLKATMSLQWTVVAGFLYVEIGVVLLLLFPFISATRWSAVFKSRIISSISNFSTIYFRGKFWNVVEVMMFYVWLLKFKMVEAPWTLRCAVSPLYPLLLLLPCLFLLLLPLPCLFPLLFLLPLLSSSSFPFLATFSLGSRSPALIRRRSPISASLR